MNERLPYRKVIRSREAVTVVDVIEIIDELIDRELVKPYSDFSSGRYGGLLDARREIDDRLGSRS